MSMVLLDSIPNLQTQRNFSWSMLELPLFSSVTRRKKEEGKKDEGRRKREEGSRKKEEELG